MRRSCSACGLPHQALGFSLLTVAWTPWDGRPGHRLKRPMNTNAEAVLQATPLFASLDTSISADLARSASRVSYPAQATIFLMGSSDDGLYVVEHGWVKAVKSALTGREQTMGTFGPGMVLNDVAVLAGTSTQATLIALEACILWRIPREAILAQIERHPALARALIGSLAARVIHLAGLVEDLALRTVEARLARLILKQADGDRIERRRWATQAELAAQVGTVPDVLNRALRDLAEAGLIAVERRTIRILDRAGLEVRAALG